MILKNRMSFDTTATPENLSKLIGSAMWLTQTYLGEPSQEFAMHGYFLFNPYTEWESAALRSIRAGLRVLGRSTKEQLAILMPDEQIDQKHVEENLTSSSDRWSTACRKETCSAAC